MSRARSGLIVDVDNKKAVVLSSTGEFIPIKVKKGTPMPEIGEEYFFEDHKGIYTQLMKYGAIAAILILFTFLPNVNAAVTTLFVSHFQVESYLVVDINPSLELGLDKNNYVKTALALNKEANNILQSNDLIGKPVDFALEQILISAVNLNYLKNEDQSQNILLTYVPLKNKDVVKPEQFTAQVEETLEKQRVPARVATLVSNQSLRKEAEELGVSAGKYIVFLEALESGLDISHEEIKSQSLSKTIAHSGGDWDQLVERARSEKDMQKIEKKYLQQIKKEVKQEAAQNKQNLKDKNKQQKNVKDIIKEQNKNGNNLNDKKMPTNKPSNGKDKDFKEKAKDDKYNINSNVNKDKKGANEKSKTKLKKQDPKEGKSKENKKMPFNSKDKK